MAFIKTKCCPICGEKPVQRRESLAEPGGRGYPGHFTYKYKCEYCNRVSGTTRIDIYCTPAEADANAREDWNKEVDYIMNFLQQTYPNCMEK